MLKLNPSIDLDFSKRFHNSAVTISTPFNELNRRLHGGLRPGELGFILALSGKGKSTMIDSMALHSAKKLYEEEQNRWCFLFLLEMTPQDRVERMAHSLLNSTTTDLIAQRKVTLPPMNLLIVDYLDFQNDTAGIYKFVKELDIKPAVMYIDYFSRLQDIRTDNWKEYEDAAYKLERLAIELSCPIWCASQATTDMAFDGNHNLLDYRHIQGSKKIQNPATVFLSVNQTAAQRENNLLTLNPFKIRRGEETPFEVYGDFSKYVIGDLV